MFKQQVVLECFTVISPILLIGKHLSGSSSLDSLHHAFSKNRALFWRVTTPDVDTGYAATRV